MTVENVSTMPNNCYNSAVSEKNSSTQRFAIPQISEQTAEQRSENPDIEKNNAVDPLNAMEAMTGKISVAKPSYTVSEDEAEYFREKYGDTYNEERAAELYYELMDKGIISINDAARSSGISVAMPLSAFNSITYFGGGDPYGLRRFLNGGSGSISEMVYVKDISRTDKNSPYRDLWNSFIKTYDRETNTWKDKLQETIDFERYVKGNRKTADHVFQQHREQVIEGLEKTKDVILKIFD